MEHITLPGGIEFYSFRDTRFKQGALSIQFVRPMKKEEAALNALLPAVLLRGTKQYPDLRAITLRLDDLYGAAVGALVRRVGDYQTTGLYCNFMEDRFALDGDEILAPMLEFVGELLLYPVTEQGVFWESYVQSEKKNLISTIEVEKNDKRLYATAQLMKIMCRNDSFGLPRLGKKADVQKITAQTLYDHYRKVLSESPVQVFYVGSAEPSQVAALVAKQFEKINRAPVALPPQSALAEGNGDHVTEKMDVAQAKLCLGFSTPVTNRSEDFAAMQVMNTIFGGDMTSKLFMNVRERMSLCYSIGSGYYGTKGILTVNAGIDFDKEQLTREEVFRQLDACRRGDITPHELTAAREAVLSSLRATHDSPGSIEGYYATAALSGLGMTPGEYMEAVEALTLADVVAAANTLTYHSGFFLKGGSQ
jgi:predicted Zn-dependent peptidase